MDNSKVTQYWEPDGNVDYPALRKPFVSSETESNTVTTNNKYVETDLVKRSTLSVDAKEFYPASYLQTPSPAPIKSVQDRLTKYNKQNIENDRNDSTSNKDVDFLYDSIEVLTVKPGKFDSILPSLLESLEPFFEDVNSVFHITEIIFTQVNCPTLPPRRASNPFRFFLSSGTNCTKFYLHWCKIMCSPRRTMPTVASLASSIV